ncbi:MMPL family transporter [Actinoplanes oblitus]|uniref:MMPL family transporter n=1 Tax=Actinoplanes oblitus TaxID=3040509 RepID=A0ABY8WQD5_9ACTN|nr:MMPL family transporter [Actinoplanes oblitus]WIM99196.1 MMPL family transporter [Actinoplanes oblitus]
MFAGWGSRVARLRWPVLIVTLVAVLGAGLWGVGVFGQLTEGGYADPTSESARAADVAAAAIGGQGGDVIAIYTPAGGTAITDAALGKRIRARLSSLPAGAVTASTSFWDKRNPAYAAKDKSSAVAVISLAGADDAAKADAYAEIEHRLAVDGATVQLAGSIPLAHASNERSTDDLGFAEMVSMPVVLILLLVIFGSLVAASLPVLIGGCSVLGALGVLHAVALGHEVNSFAVNVASLLGLGMAIDYGLFMVGRFREEQAAGHEPGEAVRRTVATAGRTVVFSATLLMTALATLLLFPQGFLKSLAYGGLAAVFLAMLLSLTLLPAILAILGPRVDKLPIRLPFAARTGSGWQGLAAFVLRRPVVVAIPILAGLIVLALPVKDVRFGENDERVLPAGDPARVAVETLKSSYPQFSSDGVQVVLRGPAGHLAADIAKIPSVAAVDRTGAARDVTVLNAALTGTDSFSAESRRVVEAIRALPAPAGTRILVGGVTARNVDSLDAIGDQLPLMIGLLAGATLLLMFLAFGSILLPIKAVIMSALSLSATFGVLVWLFQQGHGSGLLSVTPAPLEAGIVVLMAAVVFGLSTDYEVFLLSRMVEARTRGASTRDAVSTGLTSTGRVISAAALLLIVVTGAFALSAITTMRFIGVGMIIALVLDATVVRMLLVPAVLALLGDAAWWAPGPLRRLQEKAGLAEHSDPDPLPAPGSPAALSGTPSAADAATEVLDYAAVAAHLSASNAVTTVLPVIKADEEPLVAAPDETSILVWNGDSADEPSPASDSSSASDSSATCSDSDAGSDSDSSVSSDPAAESSASSDDASAPVDAHSASPDDAASDEEPSADELIADNPPADATQLLPLYQPDPVAASADDADALPAEPVESAEPSESTELSDPTEPAEPSEPGELAEPAQPAESAVETLSEAEESPSEVASTDDIPPSDTTTDEIPPSDTTTDDIPPSDTTADASPADDTATDEIPPSDTADESPAGDTTGSGAAAEPATSRESAPAADAEPLAEPAASKPAPEPDPAPVSAIPAAVADAFTWMSDPRIAGIVGGQEPTGESAPDFAWLTGPTTALPTTTSKSATPAEPETAPEPPDLRRPQTLDDWLGTAPAADAPARPSRPSTLGDLPTPPPRSAEPTPVEESAATEAPTSPDLPPAPAEPVAEAQPEQAQGLQPAIDTATTPADPPLETPAVIPAPDAAPVSASGRRPQTLDEWLSGASPLVTPPAGPVQPERRPQTLGDLSPVSSIPVSAAPTRRPQTLDEWLHGNPAQPRPQSLDDWVTGENREVTPRTPAPEAPAARPRTLSDLPADDNRPVSSAAVRPRTLGDLPTGDNRPTSSAGPRPQSLSDWLTGATAPARRPATLADHSPGPHRPRPANGDRTGGNDNTPPGDHPATNDRADGGDPAEPGDRPANSGPASAGRRPDREADPDPTVS